MSDQCKPRYSKVWHFESAEKITQFFLDEGFFKTQNVYEASAIGKGGMIFRGHSNAGWGLVPRAFRLDNPLKGYTPQPPVDFYSDSKRFDPHNLHRQLGLHLHAEVRSVMLFLDYADRVGLSTPIDPIAARETPEVLKAAFGEDFEYDFSEKTAVTKSLFVKARSEAHLLSLMGLQNEASYPFMWRHHLQLLGAEQNGLKPELPAPAEKLAVSISEELKKLIVC